MGAGILTLTNLRKSCLGAILADNVLNLKMSSVGAELIFRYFVELHFLSATCEDATVRASLWCNTVAKQSNQEQVSRYKRFVAEERCRPRNVA